jgi:gamma-glutamyltranspeptidase/glutathione hydrolase
MAPFDWSLPYPSRREGVLARNIVATSQPLAAQAGLSMLRQGGNAVDAAVATAMAMTVLEPTSNGIGSDAFALVWAGGGLHGLNASGRSPAALDVDAYRGKSEIERIGWSGVTTPGAVSAWVSLADRFGALPLTTLAEPAIQYAREGFLVARQTAYYWARGERAYADMESWQQTFTRNGKAPAAGEQFSSDDHALTLASIGASNGDSFYNGHLAKSIGDHASKTGGALSAGDLAAHEAEWVRPISMDYRGVTLHEIPPNGQGIVALIALGILANHPLGDLPVDSADSLHLQIEAMKLAFRDGHRYVADPAWMDVSVDDLLDEAYLADRAKQIDMTRATDPGHGTPKSGGTIYLAAADEFGTMVSYIQSNYTGFGSGLVVPGTGIALQNRGVCFSTEEGHPNQVAPGKRPYHTIIPGFVTKGDEPLMSFGVMGGFMQPQGHVQVVTRLADYDQNPQAALDAPRWQIFEGLRVGIEAGYDPGVYDELKRRGHDVRLVAEKTVSYGGGQAIHCLDNGYFGASDMRRDGQAVGF